MSHNDTILISPQQMHERFESLLLDLNFTKEKAYDCAKIFTNNSIDGIYTHGVNRFPVFVQYVKAGHVRPDAIPTLYHKFGGIEQWNGNQGPGPLNAVHATESAMQLAREHGIGCVALANTNHWMRGGTYGWHAARAGFVFIGITNTIGVMPAWGAIDSRLGNNPFVMALPYEDEAIVLDMAMSQYSFGAMELAVYKNEKLAVHGGFNNEGELTNDPAEVLASRRALPIGYWKGAGMSLLLDILSTVLSGGLAGHEITRSAIETNISQLFIAIDISKLSNHSLITKTVEAIIEDYHQSATTDPSKKITYPGERVLKNRKNNLANGIPVLKKVWDKIMEL
ncbi:MAG TPA: 3-dehydro-L-gulonate 2-dehydrogenase [Chitinophagaceae bacterium]|nr:3-dehydro-L-gulonate 2-dehydrogenase [Chitinophagaceae bacterium]